MEAFFLGPWALSFIEGRTPQTTFRRHFLLPPMRPLGGLRGVPLRLPGSAFDLRFRAQLQKAIPL